MTANPKPRCSPADRGEVDQIIAELSLDSGEFSPRAVEELLAGFLGVPDVDRVGPGTSLAVRIWDALRDVRTRVEQLERSEVSASWTEPLHDQRTVENARATADGS